MAFSSPADSPSEVGEHRAQLMRRATLFSLCVGALLVTLKLGAWLVTDSLSMMSSLADSLLDVIASSLNFIAVRYALQPPDDEHRFGHGKAEDLATLAQSTFICGSGLFLVIEGIKRIVTPEPVHNSAIGLGVMSVSIAFTLALVIYQRRIARLTFSSIIAADATHYLIDFLTNASVIAALILTSIFGLKAADPLFAIGIAAYIVWSAFALGSRAFQNLMDREFSDEERSRIMQIVGTHPEVRGLHDLRTRKSGIYSFIQFNVDLDGNNTLIHAHEISDRIEDSLREAFPNTEILIHQEPLREGTESKLQLLQTH